MKIIADLIELIFIFALAINSISIIPQIIKTMRLKNSDDLSLIAFAGFLIIQIIFSLHGYFHNDITLWLGIVPSIITSIWIVYLIIYYRINFKKRRQPWQE